MMKKRIIALILVLAMAMSMIGCKRELPAEDNNETESQQTQGTEDDGQSESKLQPEKGAQLLFWTTEVNFGKAVAEKFEAEYGVSVTVEEAGLDTIGTIILDGPTGNGADLFVIPHDVFQTGYSAGVFLEIDPQIASQVKEQMNPVAYETAVREQKLYGIPLSIETSALLYNKDLVQGEPADTLEQIMEEAREFNNVSENKFWFLTMPNAGYAGYPFLSAGGFELFGPDGTDDDHPGFDTPEFVKGLEIVASLNEIIPIKSDDLKMEAENFLTQSFIDGKTAYYPNGPWAIQTIKDAGVNYGITTLPTYEGKALKPFGRVKNIHESKYTEYPIAAQLFAQYLVSEESAGILYEQSSQVTARANVDNVKGLNEDKDLLVYVEQFYNAFPMPSAGRVSYYWTVADTILSAVFDGTLTPEEGSAKAQADFEALVHSE